MSVVIRRAGPADAATLSVLGMCTFIDSFGHLYTPDDMQAFLDESHSAAAYAKVLADPAQALWIAEQNGRAIGYAQAGPCGLPHAEVATGDGELKRLYVLAKAQGQNVGTLLLEAALAWLERDGPRGLWISVWSGNHAGQRFYARHGFEKAGEYEFPVGRQRDHEFIFRRRARAG